MIAALVILLQALLGFGVVRRARNLGRGEILSLSLLLGLPASSLLVIGLDRIGMPLTTAGMIGAFAAAVVILHVGAMDRTRTALRALWRPPAAPAPHEAVFLFVVACYAAASLWQCVHLPVVPRDTTTGADLVAKYAVLEGRIDSSVFTGGELKGQLSNQPYYAPFTMLMQIVYRLAGLPFGQLWLSVIFLSFLVYLWTRLRERLHPILSGFLVLSFVTIPLMYSYSYLAGTDYPNAIFLGLGVMFLHDHLRGRETPPLLLSGLFMGFACWSRSETILFVLPAAAILWVAGRRPDGGKALRRAGIFLAAPVTLFVLWHVIYFRLVFPDAPRLGGLAQGARDQGLGATITGVLRLLVAHDLYGTITYLFLAALLIDLAVLRRGDGAHFAGWVLFLLVGFIGLVRIFPAASVESTVKRGFFKLFPIMIAYLGESPLLRILSDRLRSWERGGRRAAATPDP